MDRPFTQEQLEILLQLINQAQFKGVMAEIVVELKASLQAELQIVTANE